jgi:hypothetical protein
MNDIGMNQQFDAGYIPPPRNGINLAIAQRYAVAYRHPLLPQTNWDDVIHNLVPNVGLNAMLDILYGSTSKWTNLYVFLVDGGTSPTYAAADTMGSHAGWTEIVPYSDTNRPAATFGSASGQSISNSGSVANFTINGTATVAGCGIVTNNTKSGTTGTLVGVGSFTGGNRAVASGGTLSVTVTATAATA